MSGQMAKIVFLPEGYADEIPIEEKEFVESCIGHHLDVDSIGAENVTLTANDDATGILHFIVLPHECVDMDGS